MSKEGVTYSMIVAQLLLDGVRDRGLTLKQFFEESGISQATWSRINRGQTDFSLDDMRSASAVVGLKLQDLITRADTVSDELPNMDVEVLDDTKGMDGKSLTTVVIAGAALAFLISRIFRK